MEVEGTERRPGVSAHVWVCDRLLDLSSEVSLTLHTWHLITAVRQKHIGDPVILHIKQKKKSVAGSVDKYKYKCNQRTKWSKQLVQIIYLKQLIWRFDFPLCYSNSTHPYEIILLALLFFCVCFNFNKLQILIIPLSLTAAMFCSCCKGSPCGTLDICWEGCIGDGKAVYKRAL